LVAVVPKGENKEIEKKIVIDELKKEYKAGDIVGKCEVYSGEDKIGEVLLYSDRDIKLGGIFENFKFNMKNMFRKGV
ncbi:MAG: D-alanyl-D-alanine carboxypeptidase, partial [Clostridium sp.]|nr:D-alanyl-D-alanine carboxypeptidase [Clostridium sp.]